MSYPSNSDSVAQDQIKAFVERIMRLREEAKAINGDIREVYAEAKGNGFDKTVLGKLVSYVEKRAAGATDLQEAEALFDLYLSAYDGATGTRVATHTHEATSSTAASQKRAQTATGVGTGGDHLGPASRSSAPAKTDVPADQSQASGHGQSQHSSGVRVAAVETIPGNSAGGAEAMASVANVDATASAQPITEKHPVAIDQRDDGAAPQHSGEEAIDPVLTPGEHGEVLQEGSEPIEAHNLDRAGSTPAPATNTAPRVDTDQAEPGDRGGAPANPPATVVPPDSVSQQISKADRSKPHPFCHDPEECGVEASWNHMCLSCHRTMEKARKAELGAVS